jgi:hypothetical protein
MIIMHFLCLEYQAGLIKEENSSELLRFTIRMLVVKMINY